MAKKFELGKTLGNPTPSFSVETIEEMTKKVHDKKENSAITTPVEAVKTEKKETPKVKSAPKIAVEKQEKSTKVVAETPITILAEPAKRGRKPNPPASDERMIRVSVDLPESVFIKLKTKVIQDRTDMKTFVWRLVEDTLK